MGAQAPPACARAAGARGRARDAASEIENGRACARALSVALAVTIRVVTKLSPGAARRAALAAPSARHRRRAAGGAAGRVCKRA